jgi:hypothetical protein
VPDGHVVFATAWQTAESVVEYPDSKGARFYLVQDGHLGPVDRIEETWRWPFEKVAVSRWLEERIRSVDPERVTYIPNGVEASEFRCVVAPRAPRGRGRGGGGGGGGRRGPPPPGGGGGVGAAAGGGGRAARGAARPRPGRPAGCAEEQPASSSADHTDAA